MQGASDSVQGSSPSPSPSSPSAEKSIPLLSANAEKIANRGYSLQQSQQHLQIEKLQSQCQPNRRSNSGSSSVSSLQQTRNELRNGASPLPSNPISLPEDDTRSIISTNSSNTSRTRGMSSPSQSTTNPPSSPRIRSSSARGPPLKGTASPPSTPRLSSRSKILANSATLVDGVVSPPLPYAYRTSSGASDASVSANSPNRASIPGQSHINRRLPSSPPAFLTSATGGLSLAERKRRLASASGDGATFESSKADSTTMPSPSTMRRRESEASTSISFPKASKSTADSHWAEVTSKEGKRDKGDDAKSISGKSGFRKRFSELRDNLFGEGQNSATLSFSSNLNATNYAKDEIPSSFSASIDGKKLQQSHLEVPSTMRSRPSLRSQQSQTSTQESDGGSVDPKKYVNAPEAPGMEPTASEETSHSWITSLSSVDPPEIPELSDLHFNLPSPDSPTNDKLSPSAENRARQLQRTSSWPPDEQRGISFVSVKGEGAGTGYRFENAAIQAKRSPTSEKGVLKSPDSMKSIDLVQLRDLKGRKYSETQSPSMLEFSQLFTLPSRRSNPSSSSQWETPRLPVISVQNSSAIIDENGEHTQTSSPVAIESKVQYSPRYTRSGSMHSNNSQQASPIHHTPRNSSLVLGGGNRSPTTPALSASSRNSYMTVHSSSVMHDGWNAPDNIKDMVQRREDKRRSTGSHEATGRGSSFGADALGLTNTIDEIPTSFHDFGSSPTSMMTAPQDSPQMGILGIMTEEGPPLITPSSAPSENGVLSEEPRRPSKNPLRASSSSHNRSRQLSGGEGSTLVAAATAAQDRRMTSPPMMSGGAIERVCHEEKEEGGTGSSEGTEEHTPLRKTLEEVVQLSLVDFGNSLVLNEQNQVNRESLAMDASIAHFEEVQKQSGLDSAIQLDEKRRKRSDGVDENTNAESIQVDDDVEANIEASPASITTLASSSEKQTITSRKVAPSRLTNAFSRDKTTEKMKTPEMMSPVSPGSGLKSRRMRVWPFGKEIAAKESPLALLQVDSKEANTLSRTSKISKTLRSKKDSDSPTATRPAITRVYKEAMTKNPSVDMEESDEEVEDDAASILTNQEGQSPAWKKVDGSVPDTPIALSEEMTPEMKRIIRRRNVIRELVETEKSYCADLIVVRDIYLARARSALGLTLTTPLSGYSTPPMPSPDVIVSINGNVHPSTPGYMTKSNISRNLQKNTLNEMPPASISPQISVPTTASMISPASLDTCSSVTSNRSSTYTVSSQTSQTSDTSYLFPSGNALAIPATPPSLNGIAESESASTLQSQSTSSSASTTTVATSKTPSTKPKMPALNTSGISLTSSLGESNGGILDPGLTLSDVRIIFAHLEASCSFAEDTTSVLAGCMGSFARARKVQPGDVKVEMDKNDDRLGEAFLNLMARIRSNYIDYCSRHEYSMQRYQAVMTNSSKANQMFKECTELARRYTNAWDLASLLIKPVQRVLKYPLLLQQILHCTPTSHPDYMNLQHALEDMQSVADEINRVKKRRDLADHLITGRVKEIGRLDSSPSSSSSSSVVNSFKGKKRSDTRTSKEMQGSMAALRAEDAALDRYTHLTKMFYYLLESSRNMQEQCLEWSICLRECYNSQINVLLAMRRVYRLRLDEQDEEGEIERKGEMRSEYKEEIKLIKAYIKLLLKILETSWKQVDDAIQSDIIPMTIQISKLFESPRIVMSKRDERLPDYQKLCQISQFGKQLDRKISDNALGFVALNAQLVEDLPLFLVGIQSLLDALVCKFAHIQATHFDQVRQFILQFWKEKANNKSEDNNHCNDGSSHVNITKAFGDRHSVSAAWIDSLSIVHRRKGTLKGIHGEGEDDNFTASTPGANSISQVTSPTITSHEMKKSASKRSVTNSVNSHSTHSYDDSSITAVSSTRSQPSIKPGLLRSISGPIAKKKSAEVVLPPLPLATNFKQAPPVSIKRTSYPASITSTSSKKGRHNDLIYQNQDDRKVFIQLNPISFLDANLELKRTILESNESTNGYQNVSSNKIPRSNSQQSIPPPFKRQMIEIAQERISKVDVILPPLEERRWYHDWPFINFAKGDLFQVIHDENVNGEMVHFGRIQRTGEIGWAYARCFREVSA